MHEIDSVSETFKLHCAQLTNFSADERIAQTHTLVPVRPQIAETTFLNIHRSPIPTPRNQHRQAQQPISSTSESPSVRRSNESPIRARRSLVQSQASAESPTAQLIHKLFRNRDPRLLPTLSEISPLTPTSSRRQPVIESCYSEVSTVSSAPRPVESETEDDDGSEYHSINNLSLENIRSPTPPPPYNFLFV